VVDAKTVRLTDGAAIQVGTQLDTAEIAGNVTIDADTVSISGLSSIASQVLAADAGEVKVTATYQLTLDNGSIKTSTHGTGQGGDVVLNVESISLSNGAAINSSSLSTDPGAGNAGNVSITSLGALTSNAGTIATSAKNARGGDILIDAQNVQLSNGTLISASSNTPLLPDGAGNAGNITIKSVSNVVMQNSSVTTEASHASGGSIDIDAPDAMMVQLVDSRVSTSVGGVADKSNGGNITIDPQFVVLQNSQIEAKAFAGAGGAIDIIATSAFIRDPASIVSASSTLGISGTVNIQSPLQNVGGELTALTQEFSSAAALLAQQCAARAAEGKFSTFVVAAREGLPGEPGGFLASPSLTAELLGSRLSGRNPHTQLSAITGLFPKYDTRLIQLARFGEACHRQ
jgi:large exoprotein involved in heme utilization and adhesion